MRNQSPPAAQTPLDRLLSCGQSDRDKLQQLLRLRHRLDPFQLAQEIDRKVQRIGKLANQARSPQRVREQTPSAGPPAVQKGGYRRSDQLERTAPAASYTKRSRGGKAVEADGVWKAAFAFPHPLEKAARFPHLPQQKIRTKEKTKTKEPRVTFSMSRR